MIEFINEDSKGSAEGASTAASKLVNQDKVQFIIGAMLESEVAAIYQVTKPAGVLYATANINVPGHAADVSADKDLFVRFAVSPDENQPIDLDYLQKSLPQRQEDRRLGSGHRLRGHDRAAERPSGCPRHGSSLR